MKITLFLPTLRDVHDRPVRTPSTPNVTLAYLAALVPPGHDVEVVDEASDELDLDAPRDLFAISATTTTIRTAYRVAGELRGRGVKVVIGGVHATFCPDEAAGHADSVVVGEAEESWPRLIRDLERGKLDPRYQVAGPKSLDGLPHPRYELIDYRRYPRLPTRKTPLVPIVTARGCPHRCDFCAVQRLYSNHIRYRPVGDIVEEIQASGADSIDLADENLFMNPRRTAELLDALAPLKLAIHFQTDANVVKYPELVARAAKAGCVSCFIGFESLSAESLASVGKTFARPETYGPGIRLLHEHGIAALASVILGFDGDDPRSAAETVDFFISEGVELAYFWPLIAFPGTPLYDRLREQGRLRDEAWWLRPTSDPACIGHVARPGPSSYALHALAMRRFYSAPSVVRRCFRSRHPLANLLMNAAAGLSFFRHGMTLS